MNKEETKEIGRLKRISICNYLVPLVSIEIVQRRGGCVVNVRVDNVQRQLKFVIKWKGKNNEIK
jgi:hypothetical protein